MVRVPLCARVSRVSRVCPGSPRCLFTGPVCVPAPPGIFLPVPGVFLPVQVADPRPANGRGSSAVTARGEGGSKLPWPLMSPR